jgi:hypothetical protein
MRTQDSKLAGKRVPRLSWMAAVYTLLLTALAGCQSTMIPTELPTALPTETPKPTAFPTNLTHFSGPYFGQKALASIPVSFAPGMIYGPLHTPPVFTPDGEEAYWSTQQGGIQVSRLENGFWTKPERMIFSDSMTNFTDAFIAPSGNRLFFLSTGKIPGSSLPSKENIWFVDRTAEGWGEPQPVSEEINVHELHWQVSTNQAGDLYFTSRNPGQEDIYVSRMVDGKYQTPEPVGAPVNTLDFHETTPLIAPDSSYLMFARTDVKTNGAVIRLYITYPDGGGGWLEPRLLDQVPYGLCPLVSPDGKYLFFLSSPQSVGWMSTGFIDEWRPKD